jgi:peptidyl-prolyl cis-trans isomerase SurA
MRASAPVGLSSLPVEPAFSRVLRLQSKGELLRRKSRVVGLVPALATAILLASLSACKSPVGGDVVATVDGRKIFRADVDKYYENQISSAQEHPSGEQATSLRLSILHQLIEDEIVMQRAEKLGLLATDEEVDRKYTEIRSPLSEEEFGQQLKERKIALPDFKREIRRSITLDKVMNKEVASKINVTDQDVNDYYNAHKSEFNLIEPQYHLAQLFVTPQPNPQVHNQNNKAQNEAEARKKIQMIANRLDSGDDFARLAMDYSEDPQTSGSGGDLGTVPESSLRNTDPSTRDVVMKLKPGQYTPIITVVNPTNKQLAGFRIVKLIAKEPAGQRQLADPRVQQAVRSQLHDRREQLLKAAYYEVLRDSAKVENYYAKKVLDSNGIEK